MKLVVKLELLVQLVLLVCLQAQAQQQEVCLEIQRQDLDRHQPLDRNQQLALGHQVLNYLCYKCNILNIYVRVVHKLK